MWRLDHAEFSVPGDFRPTICDCYRDTSSSTIGELLTSRVGNVETNRLLDPDSHIACKILDRRQGDRPIPLVLTWYCIKCKIGLEGSTTTTTDTDRIKR